MRGFGLSIVRPGRQEWPRSIPPLALDRHSLDSTRLTPPPAVPDLPRPSLWRDVIRRRLLVSEEWAIGLIALPVQEVVRRWPEVRVEWQPQPVAEGFVADPFFAVDAQGRDGWLAERLDRADGKGTITWYPGSDGGRESPAIVEPWHLSFPFVLRHEGETYCLPEAWESGRLTLYRRDRAAGDWRRHAVLLNVPAVDPVLFRHDGLWWLLCSRSDDLPSSNLYAWYSDRLEGGWTAHPGNPVKRDPRCSRGAGRPFVMDGALFRPTQDCGEGYGKAVVVNRVDRLDPAAFVETPAYRLAPQPGSPYPDGLHTLDWDGERTLIDGKIERADLIGALRRARMGRQGKRRRSAL